jgi:tRNA(fMet)-specific endonuclease VapC
LSFILDTDTTIYWLKGDEVIEDRVIDVGLANVGVTILTCCELYYGAYKSHRIEENLEAIEKLKARVAVIHTSEGVDKTFGRIKADLEKQGKPLDDSDMLIASIVATEGCVLVTNNVDHFHRIQGLEIENWRIKA